MRKLVYVGKNEKTKEIIETTSYEVMKQAKAEGFRFTERLDEIEEEYKPTTRAKKIAEKMKEKRG